VPERLAGIPAGEFRRVNVEEEEAWIWVPGAGVREPGPGIQSRSSSRSVTGSVASRNLSAAGHHAGPRDADHPNGDGAHLAAEVSAVACHALSGLLGPTGAMPGAGATRTKVLRPVNGFSTATFSGGRAAAWRRESQV